MIARNEITSVSMVLPLIRILVVVHAYRQDEEEIRLISARKATRNEKEQYGQFLWEKNMAFQILCEIHMPSILRNRLLYASTQMLSPTSNRWQLKQVFPNRI